MYGRHGYPERRRATGNQGSFPSTVAVTLGNGSTSGVLELGDGAYAVNQTVASLTTSGTGTANAVIGGSATASTLTVNNSSADAYAGLLGGSTTDQNELALTKIGAGVLTVSGNNTYTGPTN